MGVSGDTEYNPALDRRIPNLLATPWALWTQYAVGDMARSAVGEMARTL